MNIFCAKMKIVCGLQQCYSSGAYLYKNIIVWCLFILSISMRCNVIYAKHLEHHQLTGDIGGGNGDHHYHNSDNGGGDEDNKKGQCESVKNFFDSLNVTIMPNYENTGESLFFIVTKYIHTHTYKMLENSKFSFSFTKHICTIYKYIYMKNYQIILPEKWFPICVCEQIFL